VKEEVSFDRDALLRDFAAQNIDGRVFFWPLSLTPPFAGHPRGRVSHSLYPRGLNLPSYHDLTQEQLNRVVECVRRHVLA
jgi:perosamine synthetase